MLCSTVTATIENKNVNVVDNDYTYCLTNQTYPWFNSSDSVSLWELERLMQLTSECLFIPGHGSCKCEAEQMTFKVSIHRNTLNLKLKIVNFLYILCLINVANAFSH